MSLYLIIGIIVLVLLIVAAIWITTQTRQLVTQPDEIIEDELAEFEQMRDSGQINEEEYLRLKRIVAEKMVDRAKGK